MKHTAPLLLSVVVPLYNEAGGLPEFHASLVAVLAKTARSYEIIYIDDGSTDETPEVARRIATKSPRVRLLQLSRNFGKEHALTAGIAAARGQATLMLDGDGQHPVEAIPEFVAAWKKGAKVVIGVRTNNRQDTRIKRFTSRMFHRLFDRLEKADVVSGSTDYRLIDRVVQQQFLRLPEADRMTRGLINWLGFKRDYVKFKEKSRIFGTAAYSVSKLLSLTANSFVSLTSFPLYLFGYLGMFITALSFLAGLIIGIEQIILNDPLSWDFTGTALLSILVLFLIGIVLLSQGIMALYISHIHTQSKGRPLYIVDYENSVGFDEKTPI